MEPGSLDGLTLHLIKKKIEPTQKKRKKKKKIFLSKATAISCHESGLETLWFRPKATVMHMIDKENEYDIYLVLKDISEKP